MNNADYTHSYSDKSAVTAFFDVDDTLINIKTMFSFLSFLSQQDELASMSWFQEFLLKLQELRSSQIPREDINRYYYQVVKGLKVSELERKAQAWFSELPTNIFNTQVVECLKRHKSADINIVFVSGSCRALLEPIGKILGVDEYLCAPLAINPRHEYTGELTGAPMIGQGKAAAVLRYAKQQRLDLDQCYAYGDDISDLAMLNSVGNPRLVNPNALMLSAFSVDKVLLNTHVINFSEAKN